jgi:hypothetical protein
MCPQKTHANRRSKKSIIWSASGITALTHEFHHGKKKSAKSLNLALVRPGMAKKISWQVEPVVG